MVLPEHLTIIEIAQWKEEFISQISEASVLYIDTSTLKKIDSAGIQLLFAVKQALKAKEGDIHWSGNSAVLSKSAQWLGMSDALGITW
ncbi:STAS domain-containing protein [Neptunomonas japonica]|nr:STAS domain-containing protein [Neptunomonas japonica]